jgi:sortase (surface protein transpeptidase)
VLAAHIAFDGQDGVFVNLDKLELGSLIQVQYDDGSVVEFVATAKEQYDKNELPKESIFDRSGEPQLVLITCGGDFNSEVRSYEDNVVVYADPVDRA